MKIRIQNNLIKGAGAISGKGGPKAGGFEHMGADRVDVGKKNNLPSIDLGRLQKMVEENRKGFYSDADWTHKRPGAGREYVPSIFHGNNGGIFAREESGISKLDPATGKPLWKSDLSSELKAKSRIAGQCDDGILVINDRDRVFGVDPDNGKQAWEFKLNTDFKTPAAVTPDGKTAVFRKNGEKIQFCRLDSKGKVKTATDLGYWRKPLSDNDADDAQIAGFEKDGTVFAYATVEQRTPGQKFKPSYNKTFSISPDGRVNYEVRTMDPPAFFETDPERFYERDYEHIAAFDKKTGKQAWSVEETYIHGDCGQKVLKLGKEHKYKYLKFTGAFKDRLFIHSYTEDQRYNPGREVLCVDAKNPDNVLWRKETHSSYHNAPLYLDEDVLLHISNEEKGTVQALDPMTGKEKWSVNLKDRYAKGRKSGPNDYYLATPRSRRADGTIEENPDHYRAKKGKDGLIYVRTFKGIYGLDPKSGRTVKKVRTKQQLDDFFLEDDNKTAFVTNDESKAVQRFPISTRTEMLKREVEKIKKESEREKAGVEIGEKTVTIDGVSLPVNQFNMVSFR